MLKKKDEGFETVREVREDSFGATCIQDCGAHCAYRLHVRNNRII